MIIKMTDEKTMITKTITFEVWMREEKVMILEG